MDAAGRLERISLSRTNARIDNRATNDAGRPRRGRDGRPQFRAQRIVSTAARRMLGCEVVTEK
jgi:hypothetical protein